MRSAFILGTDSAIGSALWQALSAKEVRVVGTTRRPERVSKNIVLFDLAHDSAKSLSPEAEVAYLCAAVTKIEDCENDPAGTREINVQRLVALAERLHSRGTFVVFPSSSAVFDGAEPFPKESDSPRPTNEYGMQKAHAESLVMALGPAAVARFTKVWGPDTARLREWRRDLLNKRIVQPFDDLLMSPVSMRFAVGLLDRIGERRLSGIFHCSGASDLSYAEFARLFAGVLGVDSKLVVPKSSELAHRPRFASLGMTGTTAHLGIGPQSVAEVLSEIAGGSHGD